MAETDSTGAWDLIEGGLQVTLSRRRQIVALEATWEIAALCAVLRRGVNVDDSTGAPRAVRGISKRIEELSCAVMSALGDAGHSTDDLFKNVCIEEGGAA